MPNDTETGLRLAAQQLVDSALLLAAYIEGVTVTGAGTRDTARNLTRDVQAKADATRTLLKQLND